MRPACPSIVRQRSHHRGGLYPIRAQITSHQRHGIARIHQDRVPRSHTGIRPNCESRRIFFRHVGHVQQIDLRAISGLVLLAVPRKCRMLHQHACTTHPNPRRASKPDIIRNETTRNRQLHFHSVHKNPCHPKVRPVLHCDLLQCGNTRRRPKLDHSVRTITVEDRLLHRIPPQRQRLVDLHPLCLSKSPRRDTDYPTRLRRRNRILHRPKRPLAKDYSLDGCPEEIPHPSYHIAIIETRLPVVLRNDIVLRIIHQQPKIRLTELQRSNVHRPIEHSRKTHPPHIER